MKLSSVHINRAIKKVQTAQEALTLLVKSTQDSCLHKEQAECDYQPLEYFPALAPIRICLHCGLSEEGWGCGYSILTNPSQRKISRQQLYSLRVGSTINQGD